MFRRRFREGVVTQDELKSAWQKLGKRISNLAGIVDYHKMLQPGALQYEVNIIKEEIDRLLEIMESEQ